VSDAGKAVFLSYASRDAEAAKRIAEALRAAGVEVWFDQSELRGGDSWDAKIRRQIKECALFVPVISAATQARLEGYFRLEWKLAAQRTHTMADAKPFLVPVVIDATRDAEAHVPEEFRTVQWTHLPGGETPPAFGARVHTLLGATAAPDGAALLDVRGHRPAAPLHGRPVVPRWLWATLAVVLIGITAGVLTLRRPVAGQGQGPSRPEAATLASAPQVDPKSIAVLPFTNMSDDKENAYFADGVNEDLLTNLANVRALKVISRTTMLRYRDTRKPTSEIGRELGVAYIMEGSVRRAGNAVRVTGQLIKAATDEHVWAKTYDRDLRDIFAVQAELAREIAGALQAVLTPAEATELAARPTKSIEAYDCFQQARVLGRSFADAQDVRDKIIPLLERAVALDPDYAAAWAELCRQRLELYSADNIAAGLTRAKEALAHAEKLSPDTYAVLQAGSDLGAYTGDRAMVNDRRRRIIELFPNRAESHLMAALDAMNGARWADAQADFRAALRVDPLNPEVLEQYFYMLDSMRRWDEAEVVAATLIQVQPDNLDARLLAASMEFRRSGSTAKLTRLLAELPSGPEAQKNNIVVRSRIAYLLGDWPGIIALWRESGPRFRIGSFTPSMRRFMVADAFLSLGDPASARPLLEQNREELLRALVANPDDSMALTELGVTLGMLGDRTGARVALDKGGQLIVASGLKPPRAFSLRWEYAAARSWVDDKPSVIREIRRLLREPSPRMPLANVHVLRVWWASLPLHGDPDFEAMLNDPANNAPLF